VYGQVVAVEGVKVFDLEQVAQRAANFIDRLALDEGDFLAGPGLTGRADLHLECRFAQVGRDQLVVGEQTDVAVGQRVETPGGIAEQAGRPALGDEERERLLEGLGALRQVSLGVGQQLVDLAEILTVPGPKAVAQAIDLAVAGDAAERHGINEIEHDAAACRQVFLAVLVGAQGGRHHLVIFVLAVMRAPAGRVAEFLDLRSQRAAAGTSATESDLARSLAGRDAGQPAPVHGRIVFRRVRVEQIAVFDEQQRLDQHRRNGLEVGVLKSRVLAVVERLVVAVKDAQAGLRLFSVNGKMAFPDNGPEAFALPGLRGNGEAGAGQVGQK